MTVLTQALDDLEQRMGALGRHEALRALRPGTAPGRITTALAERGLPAPPEVQALFAWHDGVMVPPGGLVDDVDFFAVDLGTSEGQVLRVVPDEIEGPVVFSAVRNLIATIVEAYDRGVVRVEGDYLELDDRAFGRLAAEREPALPWWPAYVAGEV